VNDKRVRNIGWVYREANLVTLMGVRRLAVPRSKLTGAFGGFGRCAPLSRLPLQQKGAGLIRSWIPLRSDDAWKDNRKCRAFAVLAFNRKVTANKVSQSLRQVEPKASSFMPFLQATIDLRKRLE
jgi:hypothetical protein